MLLKQRFSLVLVLILIITTEGHTRHSLKRKDHTGSKKEVIKSASNKNEVTPRNTNLADNSKSLTKAIVEEIDKAAGDTSSISDEIELGGSDNPQLLTTRSKSKPSFMDSVNEIEKVSIKLSPEVNRF